MLRECLGEWLREIRAWKLIKQRFRAAIRNRYDRDLAETYFNSVTRKILQTVGINRDVEFFSIRRATRKPSASRKVFRTYRVSGDATSGAGDTAWGFWLSIQISRSRDGCLAGGTGDQSPDLADHSF